MASAVNSDDIEVQTSVGEPATVVTALQTANKAGPSVDSVPEIVAEKILKLTA